MYYYYKIYIYRNILYVCNRFHSHMIFFSQLNLKFTKFSINSYYTT